MEDSFLWKKFRSGDKAAIEEIYFSHYEKLIRYGLKFTNNYHLLEDCIQDLFVYIIENVASLGQTDNITFYLFKSLRRLLSKALNSNKFEIDYKLALKELDDSKNYYFEKTKNNQLDVTKIFKILNDLPERQKEIIYLKYCNELSNQEIAEILEIKNQTVRNLLYRGLKSIKGKIDSNPVSKNVLLPYSIIITLLQIILY